MFHFVSQLLEVLRAPQVYELLLTFARLCSALRVLGAPEELSGFLAV